MFLVWSRRAKLWFWGVAALCLLLPLTVGLLAGRAAPTDGKYIRWVDFDVPYEALDYALSLDIRSHTEEEVPLCWVDLLACVAARYGGFQNYQKSQLTAVADRLRGGESLESITEKLTAFSYYREAYGAVLDGLVGVFCEERPAENGEMAQEWVYGLKAFSPIAQGYYYNDYDDFGASRSYGYRRRHLGHDLMGSVGTPVIAVESGVVEAVGWNMYGGWRVGIRSLDGRRYYYYAHLRKDHPYAADLAVGQRVTAGDVIGYMGRTGYSTTENVNNIDTTHLHFGLQLIFDESQKEGNNEIWVDVYALTRLLYRHRSAVVRAENGKDFVRKFAMLEK